MTDINERALRDLLSLRDRAEKLVDLSEKLSKEIKCNENDHLGYMTVLFLYRQIDHLQSIITLVPNKDTILIARSMIEGLCQILWAAQKPEELPLKWRNFAYVSDWRLIEAKRSRGEQIDLQEQQNINNGLKCYGDQFLTKKARNLKQQGQELPSDPYHNNWRCGVSIKEIAESVQADSLYREIYSSFSDWHHWGTGGFGGTISRQRDNMTYSSESPYNAAMAIAAGFQCLLQTVQLVNEHLKLGREAELERIRNDYIDRFKHT